MKGTKRQVEKKRAVSAWNSWSVRTWSKVIGIKAPRHDRRDRANQVTGLVLVGQAAYPRQALVLLVRPKVNSNRIAVVEFDDALAESVLVKVLVLLRKRLA